jgi:hypothetical protein
MHFFAIFVRCNNKCLLLALIISSVLNNICFWLQYILPHKSLGFGKYWYSRSRSWFVLFIIISVDAVYTYLYVCLLSAVAFTENGDFSLFSLRNNQLNQVFPVASHSIYFL